MARKCPDTGEMVLYLDCMECEGRRHCRDTERSTRKEEGNEGSNKIGKEINERYEAKTTGRRRVVHAGDGVLRIYA